jgi:type II secretion system protein N
MTGRRAARIIAAAVAVAMALIWCAWLVAVPAGLITGKIGEGLEDGPVRLRFEGFGKGLFYSVKADGLAVVSAEGGRELVHLEQLRAWLNVPSLLRLSPSLDFRARLAGGTITGRAGMDRSLSMKVEEVDLSELGLERAVTGLRAGGRASLDMHMASGRGEARFNVAGMSFLPYKYMGFSLPLDLLEKAKGLLLMENEMVTVKSAALEGDGIYARASGSIGGGRVDLRLELMPSEELEGSQPYFRMLQAYRTTPGLYEIPIATSY